MICIWLAVLTLSLFWTIAASFLGVRVNSVLSRLTGAVLDLRVDLEDLDTESSLLSLNTSSPTVSLTSNVIRRLRLTGSDADSDAGSVFLRFCTFVGISDDIEISVATDILFCFFCLSRSSHLKQSRSNVSSALTPDSKSWIISVIIKYSIIIKQLSSRLIDALIKPLDAWSFNKMIRLSSRSWMKTGNPTDNSLVTLNTSSTSVNKQNVYTNRDLCLYSF